MTTTEDRGPACYVYGLVPADAAAPDGLTGLGDPPAPVTLLHGGTVAALVSELPADRPLGTVRDLRAHARVLDTLAAAGTAVLPFRFGAVLSDDRAVAADLLEPAEQQFRGALVELDGWVQYSVRGSYREEPLLRYVLASRPDVARLREETRDLPEEAARNERLRLGELIAEAVAELRIEDVRELLDRLGPLAGSFRDATGSDMRDAVHVSLLVRNEDRRGFEREVERLGRRWAERIELRLLGPLAPYDFAEDAVDAAVEAGAGARSDARSGVRVADRAGGQDGAETGAGEGADGPWV